MSSKIFISLFYALAFTFWPPDNGHSQVKEIKDTVHKEEFEFDSAGYYEWLEARQDFKVAVGTTKQVQKAALRNLEILEKRNRVKYDTLYVPIYIPVYDTTYVDTSEPHKRNFFERLINKL